MTEELRDEIYSYVLGTAATTMDSAELDAALHPGAIAWTCK